LQFEDLQGFCPEAGISGYSAEEVLKHLIKKHHGKREKVTADIERWNTGVLDLDLWESKERSKVSFIDQRVVVWPLAVLEQGVLLLMFLLGADWPFRCLAFDLLPPAFNVCSPFFFSFHPAAFDYRSSCSRWISSCWPWPWFDPCWWSWRTCVCGRPYRWCCRCWPWR
jgi:hypothetical protein